MKWILLLCLILNYSYSSLPNFSFLPDLDKLIKRFEPIYLFVSEIFKGKANYTAIYYNFVNVLDGMKKNINENSRCVDILIKEKENILDDIINIFKNLENPKELHRHGLKLLTTKGFAEYCNLLDAIPIYERMTSEGGIKEIGQLIQK